jgi:hypothetical protein
MPIRRACESFERVDSNKCSLAAVVSLGVDVINAIHTTATQGHCPVNDRSLDGLEGSLLGRVLASLCRQFIDAAIGGEIGLDSARATAHENWCELARFWRRA